MDRPGKGMFVLFGTRIECVQISPTFNWQRIIGQSDNMWVEMLNTFQIGLISTP